MKTKATILVFIVIIINSFFTASGQKPEFSGEWKLNKEKTILADNQLFLSGIKIQFKNDSLLTSRTYQNSNGEEYPFDENLSLDSKECKIVIYNMPRVSKASGINSDGSILIESKTTFTTDNGEDNMVAKENWKVDNEGKMLTLQFINKSAAGESAGNFYYNKVK
jgi:hypothetical protein